MTGGGPEDRPGILLQAHPGERRSRTTYAVAGHRLEADLDLPELTPFALPGPPPPVAEDTPAGKAAAREDGAGGEGVTFRGAGWVGGEQRRVACRRTAAGFEIEVEGAGLFTVSAGGEAVRCRAREPEAKPGAWMEALLGPALILGLALQGTYCLHASAVLRDGEAVAFVGASGSGKSTLAAHLESAGRGWLRIADDVLPVSLGKTAAAARPRYPQLKLPPVGQPSLGCPESLPLASVYLLDPREPSSGGGVPAVRCTPLTSREAAVALLSHTIAARLFDRDLLEHHLASCSGAATYLPLQRLSFVRSLEHLPRMVAALDREPPGHGSPTG